MRENLPGEVFNTYDEGGFVSWALGPERRDYLDGRAIPFGIKAIQRHQQLMQASPDSAAWQEETSRYGLNTVLLPIAHLDVSGYARLQNFCNSKTWQPVYLDEVAAVFVRRTAQTEELLQRFPVNCATAALPAQLSGKTRAEAFHAWANAAGVLAALDRNQEALAAVDHALAIFPDSATMHVARGNLLLATGSPTESVAEYQAAVALDPNEFTLAALASIYRKLGRMPDAYATMERAAQVAQRPEMEYLNLGYTYLQARPSRPEDALKAFDEAERTRSPEYECDRRRQLRCGCRARPLRCLAVAGQSGGSDFCAEKDRRASAEFSRSSDRLAQLYRMNGQTEEAKQAEERAAAMGKTKLP